MSLNLSLNNVINDVSDIQDELEVINTSISDLNTAVDTKQDIITVLDSFTISSIKANTGTIYGNFSCSSLSLNK